MRDVTLYTVILDYGGGTYIAQLTAASAVAALPIWIAGLNDEDLAEWGIKRNEATMLATVSIAVINAALVEAMIFPSTISSLRAGDESSDSSVRRSFSPAVMSIDGYMLSLETL